MFEKEAEEWRNNLNFEIDNDTFHNIVIPCIEFGYNKANEELTERLDNATEIIELMKDLFFCCWQEKGLKAIKFEQRVNDFLKGE